MLVMKFGGTSVESRDAITRVTSIVQKYQQRRPIVVVSAMGKTTNQLLAAAHEAAAGRRDQALTIVDELRGHHLTHGLALAGPAAADLDRFIRTHFEWLDELVKGLSVVGAELSDRPKMPLPVSANVFPAWSSASPFGPLAFRHSMLTRAASLLPTIASPRLNRFSMKRMATCSKGFALLPNSPSSSWAASSVPPNRASRPR